ncbi:protein GAMETE EXPRESSED 1-like [Tasmannia lanceolata]|uniref:protein GAMETE EXPRESSED 1-like n=1 Tax=Tasmannia lanceolata TaxID=3420 RepID=UPI004064192A
MNLGNLAELKPLVLAGNCFPGRILASLGGLTKLLIIASSRNFLSGVLPLTIGGLMSLLKPDFYVKKGIWRLQREKIARTAMCNLQLKIFLLVLLCSFQGCLSWGWFSSVKTPQSNDNSWSSNEGFGVADFSMETHNNRKGIELVENAKRKLVASNSCWQDAYRNLFASCSEIIAEKEKQSRLAWHLSDCFQKDTGRPAFPSCDTGTSMTKCLKNLDDIAHKIYLAFFLETNSICHQLQTDAFKHETERLVNDLRRSAQFAEDKLETIEERSESLLQSSNQIHDSLTSIDLRTQQMAQVSKDVDDQMHDMLNHSKAIFKQAESIAASQSVLQEGQAEMKAKMEADMEYIHESHQSLGHGIEKLGKEALEIERAISEVGDSISLKMLNLQSRADDIGNVAGMSLDKQKELLEGQTVALEGLNFLTKFQSQALEESRATLQNLVESGHKQQEELLFRQEQLQQTHDHLIQNSKSILAAQEAFELKQATMFNSLDKLFTLHNSILLESRFIKTFFFYSCAIFIVYILTSAKQTSAVRARLYLGICITLVIETAMARLGANDLDWQAWVESKVFWARSSFLVGASIQILYSIFTYRDYEMLNHHMLVAHHQMLLELTEKAGVMERMIGLNYERKSNTHISPWVDKELAENIKNNNLNNNRLHEEVAENSITTISMSRKYDLRPRRRQQ